MEIVNVATQRSDRFFMCARGEAADVHSDPGHSAERSLKYPLLYPQLKHNRFMSEMCYMERNLPPLCFFFLLCS